MKTPLVSVILTAFKHSQYLDAAIRSVLAQTMTDFELVVTDDADSKTTRRSCHRFWQDRRVRYRANSQRLGALMNIASALREVRGEFVTILNDDDQMEPDMLEALLPPLMKNANCVLSVGDRWMVDSVDRPLPELTLATSRMRGLQSIGKGFVPAPFDLALRGGVLIGMGAVFRRQALRKEWLVPQAQGAYDFWLGVQLCCAEGSVHFLPRRLMRYRVHDISESARPDPEKIQGEIFIFESLLKHPMTMTNHVYVKKQLAASLFILGRGRLYFKNPRRARQAFVRSLRVHCRLKPLIGFGLTFLPDFVQRFGIWFLRMTRDIPHRIARTVRACKAQQTEYGPA